jgi:hypothetical protein
MGEEMMCDACHRYETSSIPEYASGCMSCEARAIAMGPAAKQREADVSVLHAAMRRTWPDHEEYKRGRVLVWNWIKKQSVKEMT